MSRVWFGIYVVVSFVAFAGRATWAPGNISAIYLVRRHERQRDERDAREFREKRNIALISLLGGVAVGLLGAWLMKRLGLRP
jgi:hypothetical protein